MKAAVTGITCINCDLWFTVIGNLAQQVEIRYCPFCGHEYTEQELEQMYLDVEKEDEDDPDYTDEDEEDDFEEEEDIEEGEEFDDDPEDEDSIDMELD